MYWQVITCFLSHIMCFINCCLTSPRVNTYLVKIRRNTWIDIAFLWIRGSRQTIMSTCQGHWGKHVRQRNKTHINDRGKYWPDTALQLTIINCQSIVLLDRVQILIFLWRKIYNKSSENHICNIDLHNKLDEFWWPSLRLM